jgi:hypothetical protein
MTFQTLCKSKSRTILKTNKYPEQFSSRELVWWLWSIVIQKELNELKDCFNSHVIHRDHSKSNPLNVPLNVVYELFE